ncbi:MAG: glycosyltransferase family 117 protein, partial [Parafilimonas sp.]
MNYNRINNITAWAIFAFASTVYIMTSEAGGSFWDCGEFVSRCYKLQVPHPPGAPIFVMLGRIFIVLFGDNPLTAAKAVNIMNALASGFTIMFLFWMITHFAKKIVQPDAAKPVTNIQICSIIAAGIIGALAGTFTDSFWYSAVEGEVYAMSSFFTAIVFWAALKWERVADEPGADKWLIFIFFLIGISIGVHLLCLLCIPAIVMIYYFKRRPSFKYPVIRKYFIRIVLFGGIAGFILTLVAAQSAADTSRGIPADNTFAGLIFLISIIAVGLLFLVERTVKSKKELYGGVYIFMVLGVVIFGIILKGVIQYSIKAAGAFDIFFVNDLNLPFFSGFAFFFMLVAVGIWIGLRYAEKRSWPHLRLALWCIAFTLIGYSTYITTMIRSNADPSIDMFNVDNPQALEGYLGRDQYGDFPLLYGQNFTAQPVDYADKGMKYEKGEHKYIPAGKNFDYVFLPKDKMVFPRMWDMTNDQNHADYYA